MLIDICALTCIGSMPAPEGRSMPLFDHARTWVVMQPILAAMAAATGIHN